MLGLCAVLLLVTLAAGRVADVDRYNDDFGSQVVQSQYTPERVIWFSPPPRFEIGQGCLHGGVVVPVKQSVPSIDGCNRCFCVSPGGMMACTKMYCMQTNGCHVGGSVFQPGESFSHADGCNKCTCVNGRKVTCTQYSWCPQGQ